MDLKSTSPGGKLNSAINATNSTMLRSGASQKEAVSIVTKTMSTRTVCIRTTPRNTSVATAQAVTQQMTQDADYIKKN